ncbi:hypothetical protein TWF281_001702 [Arthrobotrys megalospora]
MGTIASVIFAILLSLSDLDAKRLEPWFELSKPDGATAKNSILLCYPFDFLAFVPFKAAKRGHWSVFHIGTATVLVFWFITPLQSSLIATVQQQVVMPTKFMTTQGLKKLSTFESETSSFMNLAYSISWLNSTPPLYGTTSEAVLPFEPVTTPAPGSDTQTELWAGNSTAYYAEVSCRRAEQVVRRTSNRTGRIEEDANSFFYDRSTNCSFRHARFPRGRYTPGSGEPWRPFYGQWVGYNPGANVQYYLKTPDCQVQEPNTGLFLVIFAYQRDYNATPSVNAVFCEPKYQYSTVEVTIDAHTKLAKNITYIGSPKELTPENFNATIFETIASGGGVGLIAENGGPFTSAPRHSARTKAINEKLINQEWEFESNVIGYMFAIDSDLENYLDITFLNSIINKAYKLLFTTYVASKLMTAENRLIGGRILFTTETVVVPELFARLLEGLLGAVALFLISFIVSSSRRTTGLVYDPASLAGTMALVANEPMLLEKFSALDGTSTVDELHQAVISDSLRFKLNSQPGKYQLSALSIPGNAPTPPTSRSPEPHKNEQEKNIELSGAVGIVFITLLGGLLGFMSYLFYYSNSNNGLPSFSDNIFLFQLLFSYIPTAIGTFLEPFWVLLTRFICVLQPLETLRHGHALASESLTLKFESKPPSLTILSALKSRHYFLSILAITALSTNILAIALGAIFDPITVPSSAFVTFRDQYLPSIQALPFSYEFGVVDETLLPAHHFGTGRDDHYYALYANFTSSTPLPSWTTPTHFFLPVKATEAYTRNSSNLLQAETIGVNASLSCEAIEAPLSLGENDGRPTVKLQIKETAFENSGPLCESSTNFRIATLSNVGDSPSSFLNFQYNGTLAMEAYPTLQGASNTTKENEVCGGLVPAIFSRAQALSNVSLFDPAEFEYKAILCRPKLSVHRYEITFDTSNQIVNAVMKPSDIDEKSRLFAGSITEPQLLANIQWLLRSDLRDSGEKFKRDSWLYFSRDSLPTGWVDFMIQTVSNSSRAFDPETPIRDINMASIGEQLGEVYSRVFTIVLGLYHDQIFRQPASPAPEFQGVKLTPAIRVKMSTAMFALAAALLGWYFLLAIHFYLFRVSRLFQRLPTSIASEIQLFHKSSHVLDDVRGTELLTSKQRKTHLSKLNRRYGYGRFIGRDSILRVGIEREPLLDHMSDQEVRNQGLGKLGLTIEYWARWAKKALT